ncbi:DUF7537 family lipoprotein [Halomarina oriensis]|uniref:Uncharacterized protein n=1 Tax=Halomarina oriensis TaxID=671145 RepID=A0A6B0GHA0_9EURY|nr:hypothetical protein [Halomarina oriensis]MWG34104.1 hypothetical protein [Halomarina oriensis]
MSRITMLVCGLLVVLAGCAALPDDAPAADPYTGPNESLDTVALLTDHTERVEAADSSTFAATHEYTVVVGPVDRTRTTTVRFERDDRTDESWFEARYTDSGRDAATTQQAYRTADRTVGRYDTSRETVYVGGVEAERYLPARFETVHAVSEQPEFSPVAATDWTFDGVVTRDGESLTRYTASGTDRLDRSTANVTDGRDHLHAYEATLLVTGEGVIRELLYTYRYTPWDATDATMTETVRLRTTGLNGTSVDEPSWLGEANERATA